jgi:hypothetical protein
LLKKNLPCSLRSRGIFFRKALPVSGIDLGAVAYQKDRRLLPTDFNKKR